MVRRQLLLLLMLFSSSIVRSQVCSNLGQNPGTAFPVCGASVFTQTTVSQCVNREIPTPCPNIGAPFEDRNPYWYKFTCFSSGTLGFVITPNNLADDYDWQLFDITGHAPEEIYIDKTLFVACNWSGDPGKTGASAAGTSLVLCAGERVPLFSSMPELQQGHNYLLLVSHFTNSQSGYTLDFTGGSASITDTTPPRLAAAKALCDNKRIGIKLNKRMKCGTLAANGSDFTLSDPSVTISEAMAPKCNAGFDMDSLIVTLSNPLPPGNYSIRMRKGTDANSLLDNCDAAIPENDSLSFTISPSQPAAFDSITTPSCAPDQLTAVFSDAILCNSIAADGSDFTITGPTSVIITGATTSCTDNSTTAVQLKLSAPLSSEGIYTVILKKGTDGNTILNECSIETPEGGDVSFTTTDTVSADFNYTLSFDCKANKGTFNHNGGNGINNWYWQFGTGATTTVQNPVYIFPGFTSQKVTLYVSNGRCTDSSQVIFNFDNEIKADFTAPDMLCPEDVANFKDTSRGKIVAWDWNFGNGNTSASKDPSAQIYPVTASEKNYPVRLIVKDINNCFDTAYKQLKVLYNCYIAVPTAFTPNGDGRNDYLYPVNAYKAKNLIFKVYNRLGQLVFETTDFTRKWDGTFKGMQQQTGAYVWSLKYINTDTGQPFSLHGTTILIR